MTARERVIAALNHQRPDRIPRYEIFFKSFADQWRRTKYLPEDADVNAFYKIDVPRVFANQRGPFWNQSSKKETGGDAYYLRDSWGRLQKKLHSAEYSEVLEWAIREKTDLDKPEFSDLAQSSDIGAMERHYINDKLIKKLHDHRFAPVTGVMGLYQACTWLRGDISFMTDMADDAAFCHALAGKISPFLAALGERMLAATNTRDTAIWVYDDFSTKTGPLISPAMFEKYFLEPYKRMFARWKSGGARHIVLHHDVMSVNCYPVIDLFLEAGITGVQGVYPTAELRLPAFKARYGRKLGVIGGMCNTRTLPFGSIKDIEREVAEIVEAGSDGGVVAGAHSIEKYIPVEQYERYIAALDKAGGPA